MKIKTLALAASIFLPMSLFAQSDSATTSARNASLSTTTVSCIQTALDKRENFIISAHDVFNISIKTALTARLANLKAAYTETTREARKEKRQAAHKQFNTAAKAAHNTVHDARKAAWKTFDTDAKACGVQNEEKNKRMNLEIMPF